MKLHVATALLVVSHALLAQSGSIQSGSITLPPSAPKDQAAVKQLFYDTYTVYTYAIQPHNDDCLTDCRIETMRLDTMMLLLLPRVSICGTTTRPLTVY